MFGIGKKITLYVDADDTILKSSEAIVKMINKRFAVNPPKSVGDLHDWNYQSICPKMNDELVNEMYSSEEFFELVEMDDGFAEFYHNNKSRFNWVIVTKGTRENLRRKKQKLIELMGKKIKFIGLPLGSACGFSKKSVDMGGGIQIDDRVDCLEDTNAALKVLVTWGRMLPWNHYKGGVDNFYIVKDMGEVAQVCEFAAQNHKLYELEKK